MTEHVAKSVAWDVNAETIKTERARIAAWLRADPGSDPRHEVLLADIASAIEGGVHTAWLRRD